MLRFGILYMLHAKLTSLRGEKGTKNFKVLRSLAQMFLELVK